MSSELTLDPSAHDGSGGFCCRKTYVERQMFKILRFPRPGSLEYPFVLGDSRLFKIEAGGQ